MGAQRVIRSQRHGCRRCCTNSSIRQWARPYRTPCQQCLRSPRPQFLQPLRSLRPGGTTALLPPRWNRPSAGEWHHSPLLPPTRPRPVLVVVYLNTNSLTCYKWVEFPNNHHPCSLREPRWAQDRFETEMVDRRRLAMVVPPPKLPVGYMLRPSEIDWPKGERTLMGRTYPTYRLRCSLRWLRPILQPWGHRLKVRFRLTRRSCPKRPSRTSCALARLLRLSRVNVGPKRNPS